MKRALFSGVVGVWLGLASGTAQAAELDPSTVVLESRYIRLEAGELSELISAYAQGRRATVERVDMTFNGHAVALGSALALAWGMSYSRSIDVRIEDARGTGSFRCTLDVLVASDIASVQGCAFIPGSGVDVGLPSFSAYLSTYTRIPRAAL